MRSTRRHWTTGFVLALVAIGPVLSGCAASAPAPPAATPASPEERAVRAALAELWAASGTLERMLPHYADDARIDSLVAGGKVPRAQWETAMRAWLATPEGRETQVGYRIDRVAFSPSGRATVDTRQMVGRSSSFTQSGFGRDREVRWELEQRNGRWLVVETTYTRR
jgi:hypothetical protein